MGYLGQWAGLKFQKRPNFLDRNKQIPGPNEMAEFRRNFEFSGRNSKPWSIPAYVSLYLFMHTKNKHLHLYHIVSVV